MIQKVIQIWNIYLLIATCLITITYAHKILDNTFIFSLPSKVSMRAASNPPTPVTPKLLRSFRGSKVETKSLVSHKKVTKQSPQNQNVEQKEITSSKSLSATPVTKEK